MRARLFLCVAFATLAFLASPAPARAQQACTWGAPTFTHGGEGTPTLWTRVRITCNGGIGQCAGRVILRQYVWDAFYRIWVERPNTSQSQVFWALCGETVTRGYTGPISDWPDPCIGCITTEFQVPNITGGYTSIGTDNFYFNNF